MLKSNFVCLIASLDYDDVNSNFVISNVIQHHLLPRYSIRNTYAISNYYVLLSSLAELEHSPRRERHDGEAELLLDWSHPHSLQLTS